MQDNAQENPRINQPNPESCYTQSRNLMLSFDIR